MSFTKITKSVRSAENERQAEELYFAIYVMRRISYEIRRNG